MRIFTLYVDGACSGNPGPGGWAVISVDPEEVWETGCSEKTTNNEMELKALVVALDYVPRLLLEVEQVIIISDSQWAVNMALSRWQAHVHVSLVRVARDKVRGLGRRVQILWERGHQGNIGNELANLEAQKAIHQLL